MPKLFQCGSVVQRVNKCGQHVIAGDVNQLEERPETVGRTLIGQGPGCEQF
ncbi:MAG: hypothetical protein OXC02_03290 [Rhodobacteraceae bacterium]|nr:hypothetical protein [Paracoccaceae bacterium]